MSLCRPKLSRSLVVVSLVFVIGLSGCVTPPETVDFVDLERYEGLWYEIASYPTFFNQDLVATTAQYTLREDGRVDLINRARVGDFDGPETTIAGVARTTDPNSNSRLAVRFNQFPVCLFEAHYWIIELDQENYQYAVVSDPRRSTLFILSRTPTVDDQFLQALIDDLAARGFDPNEIQLTPQPPQ
ncbi:MAG: lipocalin family protein [Phycisphaerae bacterium]|nr:lipocalin family protein [Phycisphaerae bacterium]